MNMIINLLAFMVASVLFLAYTAVSIALFGPYGHLLSLIITLVILSFLHLKGVDRK